jgi:hypothetical protein
VAAQSKEFCSPDAKICFLTNERGANLLDKQNASRKIRRPRASPSVFLHPH